VCVCVCLFHIAGLHSCLLHLLLALLQDIYAQKMKHWGRKAPGIVAKMVTTLKPPLLAKEALGLHFKRTGTTKHKYWNCILKAKFEQNADAKRILLHTAPSTLVEQARFPRASNYWDASIAEDGQSLIGHNVMGRLVQHTRDQLCVSAAAAAAADTQSALDGVE
jgi:predicted NAD-dependent protein-ADP-ribosyltransferase YbiA (DUF1768 family)